ncbi:hypothetical protein GCM10023116_21990 [Kistimonas scapharcae]|uniref:Uncharacterized protein n=1 Tax=Kistimonas scapharcae TaxID=1036133 RepID=A0ABP8V213_9GAMM
MLGGNQESFYSIMTTHVISKMSRSAHGFFTYRACKSVCNYMFFEVFQIIGLITFALRPFANKGWLMNIAMLIEYVFS